MSATLRQRDEERARLLADCRARLHPLPIRRALLELGTRLTRRGIFREADDIFFLYLEEVAPICRGSSGDVAVLIAQRRAEYARNRTFTPPPVIIGDFNPTLHLATPADSSVRELRGLAVSPGIVTGPARVLRTIDEHAVVLPGEILVAPFTDPGWTPYFLPAAAIVMDMGGLLTHGSIIAREYGIPAVVNVGTATQVITTGQRLQVDGNRGVVRIVDEQEGGG